MKPKFSIIMASLLADYPHASTRRHMKLVRAVKSCLEQTFQDWELIICSDGCDTTDYMVKQFTDERIRHCRVERNGLFTNDARNTGIAMAKGEYIIYLDSDDFWGADHLQIFADNLNGEDWVWANDFVFYDGEWHERTGDIEQYAHCGTSNICHAKRLGVTWGKEGYGHDYHLIQRLLEFKNYKQIPTGQYMVCHIGGAYEI